MDVAVLGVAEDHRVVVAVLAEQPDQALARGQQVGDGHGDVLEQRRGARRPRLRDLGVETLAQLPQPGLRDRVAGQLAWPVQRQPGQQGCCCGTELVGLRRGVRAVLDEQRGVPVDGQGAQPGIGVGVGLPDPQ